MTVDPGAAPREGTPAGPSPARDGHLHEPVVAAVGEVDKRYLICGRCGLLLWFVALEDLGVNTADWSAPEQVPGS